MSALEIQQMPRSEKLKLMETLWADLSRDEAEVESPAWHADALRETAERVACGEEKILADHRIEQRLGGLRRSELTASMLMAALV
jgi:Putative addiction module component